MAGSEKSGYSNSKAMLIENAYYILTPTPQVAEEKVQTYEKFVESLKALPLFWTTSFMTRLQEPSAISHISLLLHSLILSKHTIHMMR